MFGRNLTILLIIVNYIAYSNLKFLCQRFESCSNPFEFNKNFIWKKWSIIRGNKKTPKLHIAIWLIGIDKITF